MKKLIGAFLAIMFLMVPVADATTHLSGKIVALDAGHGGSDSGAVNVTYGVLEKDVNMDVVLALKTKLEAAGAQVVLTREGDETITSRRERVNIAKAKCEALGGDCDILISVHHNGASDPNVDYTQTFVTQKKDKALGEALQDRLVTLTGVDKGVSNDGFGMTVHGNLVSALTEGYFITNDTQAFLYTQGGHAELEADLLFTGVENYFATNSGGGGGKPPTAGPKK